MESNYNLEYFYPSNISSDLGFKETIDHLIKNYRIKNCITPIVVDINIYWRYYKWSYNPTNDNKLFNDNFIPVLGFWHNYKELSQILWRSGIEYLFGPLSHLIWPDSGILVKPRLEHLEIFYTYLALCYDKILEDYLNTMIITTKLKHKVKSYRILKNIRMFFRSVIPFVCKNN